MKALIVGGGIGGLAAAIALALRGVSVEVHEQAPALTEVGAGLQISPNGWRVLEAMGVAPLLRPSLFEPEAIEMRQGISGRRIFALPLKGTAEARWGGKYIHIHRADLVSALAQRLDTLAPGAVHVASKVTGYRLDGVKPVLNINENDSAPADLIVGADGLHSVIRRQMLGSDAPRYTGNIAWRAVVPIQALGADAPPPTACVWVGDKRHAVTTRLRGGTLANFVGMVETNDPVAEDWHSTGSTQAAAASFAGWHPTITNIIAQAETLNCWALYDRAPLSRWHDGAVTLLGDAAHPMLPSMAQGAVQALEDAWVLAACIAKHTSVAGACETYFQARIARTARIQKGSAANGRLFHHAAGLKRWAVYGPISVAATLAPGLQHRRQDWVYEHDVTLDAPL